MRSKEQRLKILMVTTFYPPFNFGGDGIFVHRLSNVLAREGHKVDIVHCIDAYNLLQSSPPTQKYENHPNITIHGLKSEAGFLSPWYTHQTGYPAFKSPYLKKLIREQQFEVIHYHNISLIGLGVLPFGNSVKLYTTHEYWLVCPMHVLWKYGKAVCSKKRCLSCQVSGGKPVQWWRFSNLRDKMTRHVDRFIAPTRFTIEKHKEFGFSGPFVHIPHFLPEPQQQETVHQPLVMEPTRPYILYVGRLEKIKGVQTILPTFKNHPEVELLIAGTGHFEEKLKEMSGSSPNIHFLGQLDYSDLVLLYRNALAAIVPSVCYEIFGLVALEAFAQKTPVIARNIGGLQEIITVSGGGLTFETEEELAHLMELLQQDSEFREDLGRKGYDYYHQYCTEEQYLQQYYRLILEVATEKNLTSPALKAFAENLQKPSLHVSHPTD